MKKTIGFIVVLVLIIAIGIVCGIVNMPEKSEATLEQQLACKKAETLLETSAHSYQGLIDSLEFAGFTHEDAVYAVDRCGADWNKQAYRQAKSYKTYNNFSREETIRMLTFWDGFTREQAIYAVDTADIYK